MLALAASITMHTLGIIACLCIPLVFHNALPDSELLTFLTIRPWSAVPPPPPPPPPPAHMPKPKAVEAQFVLPTRIPKSIPPPPQDEAPPIVDNGALNAANSGISGGIAGLSGGIPGGLVVNWAPPPPPPPPKPIQPEPPPVAKVVRKPIYVGGELQEAKLVYKQSVSYPVLALKAHISGVVVLRITVDEEGNVTDIKVVNGHPVLVPAAVDAVSRWKYKPTLLNGQPVPVIATVAVNFALQ